MSDGEANRVYVDLAVGLIERITSPAIKSAKAGHKKISDELSVIFRTSLKPYLIHQAEVLSKIKILINPREPVEIEKVFEPPSLSINTKKVRYPKNKGITFDDFTGLVKEKSRLIITAIAGSGKSVMIKYLFLQMIKNSTFVPVFVELRHLNDLTEVNLETLLSAQILAYAKEFNVEQLRAALRSGKICLLFDGFDELNPELRSKVKKQIDLITSQFPLTPIVMSSRPDEAFLSWSEYTEYYVHPFNKDEAISLIEKMPFDKAVKSKFLKRVKSDLFSTHQDFLSNPLLTSMMLLTFESSYDIPSKRHIFYQRAFQALIEKHDASKGYKRQFKSSVQQDEFETVFSAFCIYSFLEGEYSFTEESAVEYARMAFELVGLEDQSKEFSEDLVKCVCMLVQDGDRFSFIHRSFQEYFAACFVVYHADEKLFSIMKRLVEGARVPMQPAYMAHEINKDLVEFNYVLPRLSQIHAEISDIPEGKNSHLIYNRIVRDNSGEKGAARYLWELDVDLNYKSYQPLIVYLMRISRNTPEVDISIPKNWHLSISVSTEPKPNNAANVRKVLRSLIDNIFLFEQVIGDRRSRKLDLMTLLGGGGKR